MSEDVRARLARLDSCAIADAGDALGVATWLAGIGPVAGGARIVGRCVTVRLGPPSPDTPRRHLCAGAIEASGPGDVIVVAHQGRTDCAGWGGNLSRAAKYRGIIGTVVDGAVRDVDEADSIGYSVFAVASTPMTARGRTQEHEWGGDVRIGDVDVATGDWLLADRSGVVVVPAARLDGLLDRAEAIARKEAAMAAAIDDGTPVGTVMGNDYETMLEDER